MFKRLFSKRGSPTKSKKKENKNMAEFEENKAKNTETEQKADPTPVKDEKAEAQKGTGGAKDTASAEKGAEKTAETPKDVATDGVEQPKNEEGEPNAQQEPTVPQDPTVLDTEPVGNGIRIEDLVTKDELLDRLAAFEAKFQALVKENQDLKDKYENRDFGNVQRQGMPPKDKSANSSFDEYAKQFM